MQPDAAECRLNEIDTGRHQHDGNKTSIRTKAEADAIKNNHAQHGLPDVIVRAICPGAASILNIRHSLR